MDGTSTATPETGASPPWLGDYPPTISWTGEVPVGPVAALLDRAVAAYGDRPCIDFLGKRYTYAEIGQLADRFAAGLQAAGFGKGSRIGLLLPNSPYYLIAFFGALKAGATVVNFNPLNVARELAQQVDDSRIEWMVTLDLAVLYDKVAGLVGRAALTRIVVCPMADSLPFPKNRLFPVVKRRELACIPADAPVVRYETLIAGAAAPTPVELAPETDLAILQYTGGTTGIPKGAMLTHANLSANIEQCAQWFHGAHVGAERVLGVLPFFHVFAMTVALGLGVRLAAELILVPRFEIDAVMKLIHRKKPTLLPAVPTIFTAINTHPKRDHYDLSSIRYCISGGAPLPLQVKTRFEQTTGCSLVEGYGLTEAAPVVTCNPLEGRNKEGAVGLPLPQTVVEIVSLEDGETVMPVGERGEVCVRGPQVMVGYLDRPDETEKVMKTGRLHTGDVGYMDEDGYFYLVDRIKDLILCSGFNVYPRMVEEAIYLHPEVEQCVVAGVPDDYRGQSVKAYVKLAPDSRLTAEELVAFLGDKLSPIELPRAVEFRDELPRTMIGKLSRKALLEEEAARRGDTV